MKKLIRDNVPKLLGGIASLREEGVQISRIDDDEEFSRRLLDKAREEVEEVASVSLGPSLDDGLAYEIADVLEALQTYAQHKGVGWGVVLACQVTKRKKQGGFEQRLLWEGPPGV